MHVEDRGLIYDARSKPDSGRIAFFTGLCPLRSGTILAGFQVGSGKHAPTAQAARTVAADLKKRAGAKS